MSRHGENNPMSGPEVHEFSRALGSLEASVKNLTMTWAQQEQNAADGRRALHLKMDGIKEDLSSLTSRVDGMTKEMSEISPAVNEFKQQRERAIGAMKLGRWLWGVFIAAAGLAGWAIGEWLHIPRPPH
jgi:tetrahydromethanopterin S-methyltransferase subunit B